MSDAFIVPHHTRLVQDAASDPRRSAWLSANAGSGKTHVLARRIVRLLLDGVDPACILALTFTKAAAANMATRVFDLLGHWVTLDDATLAGALREIDGRAPGRDGLARARRLFARAVETPGGLKIQTIHAFCERLLHLFPFEANVAASFEVMDETTSHALQAQARNEAIAAAIAEDAGPLADARSVVSQHASEDDFAKLVQSAIGQRHEWGALAEPGGAQRACADLAALLELGPNDSVEHFDRQTVDGAIAPEEWPRVLEILGGAGRTDRSIAEKLAEALATSAWDERAELYRSVFLTKEHLPRSDKFLTSAFRAAHPELANRLTAERDRIAAVLERRKAAATLDRTRALMVLAREAMLRYEARKSLAGLLDFNDLIARTLSLLRRHAAAWVLYKLDQGIDHILVDEAQDTSDPQWQILDALLTEFTAGEGGAERVRTVFAVGDPKQSIFSFQGAAPATFERTGRELKARFGPLERQDPARWSFVAGTLGLSFRSAPEILRAVDTVFAVPDHLRGLSSDAVAPTHESARNGASGLVEIWDTVPKPAKPKLTAWEPPLLDASEAASPPQVLARRIARLIARWRTQGDKDGKIIGAGDVLILVRSRNAFFEAMIRALKEENVPVAGADRLALSQHIAVMDLVALGRASLLPDDDLTLATVLRSPLIGLSEEALRELAEDRPGALFRALEAAAGTRPAFAEAARRIASWRARAARTGPFGFYAAVLGPDGGRRAMLGRLGPEAGDALDEFLRLALEYEHSRTPTLAPFLAGLDDTELMVKRDMEAPRDEVRVMTIHGAKGLEAPVVFLPDTCGTHVSNRDRGILRLSGRISGRDVAAPAWVLGAITDCRQTTAQRRIDSDLARDESDRLLYVAMTRARDRLIIAGYERHPRRPARCWYDMVRGALEPLMTPADAEDGEGRVLRLQTVVSSPVATPRTQALHPPTPLPDWARTPTRGYETGERVLNPSSALAPSWQFADAMGTQDGRVVGRLVHALLESLPGCAPGLRRAAASRLIGARAPSLAPDKAARIVEDVCALIAAPGLAALFGPGSRAEAMVAGRLRLGPNGEDVPVSGQIDRLAVTGQEVIVADYKTSSGPPPSEPPESYVAQLAIYRALLLKLYPQRRVRCLLIWTSGPVVVELPDAALERHCPTQGSLPTFAYP